MIRRRGRSCDQEEGGRVIRRRGRSCDQEEGQVV